MRRSATTALLTSMMIIAVAGLLLAAEQFAGEVLKVDVTAKKVTVKKPDGNRFTFVVGDKTSFTGPRKALQDLTKGDKVTIEFEVSSGQYRALQISSQ
jgi:Cu/Ag efflux protein CusF